MAHQKRESEEWARDIEDRQRNVVFPDTVQNEARFWRNIGNQRWTPTTVIGLAILALFAGGFLAVYVIASVQEGVALKVGLTALLIWGPIFGAIAWATRRALRNSSHASKRRK
jgi:high-affinity Fe2+/Pb2+ permease